MAGLGNVLSNLNKWAEEKRIGVEGIGRVTGANAQNYARANRRWLDQSGHARAGLHGGCFWESPSIFKVFVAHSKDYGVWLEIAMDRHYMILEESIAEYKQSFFDGIKKVMDH